MLSVAAVVVVCLTNALLGAVVLANGARSKLNRVFAGLTFALAAWSGVAYLEDVPSAQGALGTLARFDYGFSAVILGLFFWFCSQLTAQKRIWLSRIVLGLSILVALMSALGLVVQPTIKAGNVVLEPRYGYVAFVVLLAISLGAGFGLLGSRHRHTRGQARAQLSVVMLGLALSVAVLIAADVIAPAAFGISSTEVARLGIYGLLFFTGLSTYAIIRHRLFDVRRLVARSLTYVLLLGTLAVGYVAVAFAVSRVFFSDTTQTISQTVTYAVLSVILAFVFQPLRRMFEKLTDRVFYRDQYDSGEVLDGISRILVSEIDLDRTLSRSLDIICRELHIQFGQVVIFNHDRVYRVAHFGPLPHRLLVAPELRRFGSGLVVADELTTGERKELLEGHGLRLSLALKTGGELVGYLLLGDKLSGNSYTRADLDVLATIGKELAVGVANAKAYAEIQSLNASLQDRINHATSRLRVANRHLKELDKTKDEFISMASHQLRTPLTTIKGYLSMMDEGDAGKLSATQKEFVGYAFDASERMVNLISDLLNVSRLEAGRFMIQAKPIDLVAMVADEVRQLQQHAVNKGLSLVFVPPKEVLPEVELDDNKTRQVIMNFIDNAIYYTKQGGVTVAVTRSGNNVRLTVTDTGIGVPEAAKKKLFSKFYRAENAQGVRPDGTGLGLYLARRVIADQNGTIIFNSTEGHGSTFGFELPLTPVSIKG